MYIDENSCSQLKMCNALHHADKDKQYGDEIFLVHAL